MTDGQVYSFARPAVRLIRTTKYRHHNDRFTSKFQDYLQWLLISMCYEVDKVNRSKLFTDSTKLGKCNCRNINVYS